MANFRFKPQPDISAYELALLWSGHLATHDDLLRLPLEMTRHFEAESFADQLVIGSCGPKAALESFRRRDRKPPKGAH